MFAFTLSLVQSILHGLERVVRGGHALPRPDGAPVPASRERRPDVTLRWTEGVRRELLPNGLTLLAQRIPDAPAVAVLSYVRAGFFDEPDRLAGVSHVLEHMLFKGTPSRGVGDLARETKAAGGSLNAGTGYDHTAYITVLPPEALDTGLELQSDALQRSLLDPEELRRELVVIVEEAKRKLDTPAAVTAETLHALLFDRHRIRRWRIGTEAHLAGLGREQVFEFYRRYYRPGNTIVALVGDLDPEAACAAAGRSFGSWPAAPVERDPSPPEPSWREVRARTLRGDVQAADLTVGWRSVPTLHPDAAALDVAALILTAGRAGWLYQRLRSPGIMTAVGASHFTPTEVGVFSISGELDPARLSEALQGIGECVARLREEGPQDADLARVRTLLEARWAGRLEPVEGRAGALAAAEALGSYRLVDEQHARLLAVGGDEIRRVAASWLDPGAVCGAAYLPAGAPAELDPDRLREALSVRPEPAITRMAWPVSRPAPRPLSRPARSIGAVLHLALPGADLLLRRKAGVPLASLSLYQHRAESETLATAGLAALAVRSAVRGAGDLDTAGLALAFENLGGVLAPLASADWFGFGTTVLAHRAADAAVLLDLVLRYPRLESREIEQERQTLLEAVQQDADDMMRYPVQLAFRAGFGPSGYGLPVPGVPESVPGLTAGMVRDWHHRVMTASGCRPVLVVAGAIEPERLGQVLAGIFETYPARSLTREPVAGWPSTVQSGRLAVDRAKRQTAIAMLFPGPSSGASARHEARVWAALAGGLGGRLFTALRDQRSLAYVVHASAWQRMGAGALLVYLATSPEREAEARGALLGELARMVEHLPEPSEVDRAIRYLSGQLRVGRQRTESVAAEIAEAWLNRGETGLRELIDPARGIRAVTEASLQELVRNSFLPERRFEGLIRGGPAMFRAPE